MTTPTLFIVGHSKSGTTALAKFLGEHPQVFMSDPKEPNFFARDFTAGVRRGAFAERSEAWYRGLFAGARPDQIAGEASACYLASRVAAREIAAFEPDAKVIVMLREPVSFLQSFHLQLLRNEPTEAEAIREFEEALAAETDRKRGRRLPAACQAPHLLLYSERIQYAEQVGRYFEHFGRERVKVIVYDDFREDNRAVFRDVLTFVGVDDRFEPAFKTYNKGMMVRSARLLGVARQVTHGRGAGALIHAPLKRMVPPALRKRVAAALYDHILFGEKPPLPTPTVTRLKQTFRPEVERISELLDRDLVREWGYA